MLSDIQKIPISENQKVHLNQLVEYLPEVISELDAQLITYGKKLPGFVSFDDKTISMIEQINQRIKDILYNSQYREDTDFIMGSLPYVVSTYVTKFDIVQILKNIRKDLPILLTPEKTRKLLDHLEEVRKEFNTIGSYSRRVKRTIWCS